MTHDQIIASLRDSAARAKQRRIFAANRRAEQRAGVEPPRADFRRVDGATIALDLPCLIEQRELIPFTDPDGERKLRYGATPTLQRHKGRLGSGERLMSREPRLGNGKRAPVTVKLAEFTRTGRVRESVVIETRAASSFRAAV